MFNRQKCHKLFVSWVLILVGGILCAYFKRYGLLFALIPFSFAQNIRLDHDRAMLDSIREKSKWMAFIGIYYISLLLISIYLVFKTNFRLGYDVSVISAVLIFMFPIITAMITNDIKQCSQNRSDYRRKNIFRK